MSLPGEIGTFYRQRVPAQFNRTLARQRKAAIQDDRAAGILEEMEAVRASILVGVHADGHAGGHAIRVALDIEHGQMQSVENPSWPPFLTLSHEGSDFESLRRECGDSVLGFLGGLAGLGDELRLTSQRVRSLRELAGSLVLERTGADGFQLRAHFGDGPPEPQPRATIRLDEATHRALRSGTMDPQEAFLSDAIEVHGDEGMAINLALTALAPD